MSEAPRSKSRRRSQALRRLALLLVSLGASSERISRFGMGLGVLAGLTFVATGELARPEAAWTVAAALCLARIVAIRIAAVLQPASARQSREEEFYNELPERVSDAVTVVGFGFAADSSPWLGLAAALAAIFSAYIRSFTLARGGGREHGVVLMNRTQRLALLAAASVLFATGVAGLAPSIDLPSLVLWIIIAGCLFTVGLRWFEIRAIKV